MEIKIYGAFALNLRVDIHAIDATPVRWRGDAGSSPLDGASTAVFSPRNDLVKNYRGTPDALVDFHTANNPTATVAPIWQCVVESGQPWPVP